MTGPLISVSEVRPRHRTLVADHRAIDGGMVRRWQGEDLDLSIPLTSDLIAAAVEADARTGQHAGGYFAMTARPETLSPAEPLARAVYRDGWRPAYSPRPTRDELVDVIRTDAVKGRGLRSSCGPSGCWGCTRFDDEGGVDDNKKGRPTLLTNPAPSGMTCGFRRQSAVNGEGPHRHGAAGKHRGSSAPSRASTALWRGPFLAGRLPLFMLMCEPAFMALHMLQVDEEDEREMQSTEVELSSSNPDVDRDQIRALVQTAYDRLTPAKVHTYLPVLVAREVQDVLRSS
jgi:hypothetical protein